MNPKDWIWHVYLSKIKADASTLMAALLTWEPDAPESAHFLELLTRKPFYGWWREQKLTDRKSIIKELVRIDDGRGIIHPWLSRVIREEEIPDLLEEAAKWKPKMNSLMFPVLEDWSAKTTSPLIGSRMMAWQKIYWKWERLKESHGSISYEETGMVRWEKHITQLLAECLPQESDWQILRLMSLIKPSFHPSTQDEWKKVFYGWGQKMKTWQENRSQPVYSENERLKKEELKNTIWQGLISSGAGMDNVESATMKTEWMERRSVHEIQKEALKILSEWKPSGEKEVMMVAALFGTNLLQKMDELWEVAKTSEKLWESAWKVWGKLSRPADLSLENAWEQCRQTLKEEQNAWRLLNMERPAWLTDVQQETWNAMWMEKLRFSSCPLLRGAAAIHLLRLDGNSPSVWQVIFDRLENASAADATGMIEFLIGNIEKSGRDGKTGQAALDKVWQWARSSAQWEDRGFRLGVVRGLQQQMENAFRQEGTFRQWTDIWAEIIDMETDTGVLHLMSMTTKEWQSGNFSPPVCPKVTEAWRKWLCKTIPDSGSDNARPETAEQLRKNIWEFMAPLGDEVGELLVACLKTERSPRVLYAMAEWRPSGNSSLPAGFWETWAARLSGMGQDEMAGKIVGRLAYRLEPWAPQTEREMTEAVNFWSLVGSLPVTGIDKKAEKEIYVLREFAGAMFIGNVAPENFQEKLKPENIPGPVYHVLEKKMRNHETGTTNLWGKQNQAAMAAFGLRHLTPDMAEKSVRILARLWNEPPETSAEHPTGWESVKELMLSDTKYHNRRQAMQLAHRLDSGYHKIAFLKTIDQVRNTPGHPHADLMDITLWREMAVVMETFLKKPPAGKQPDQTTEYLALRELIHGRNGDVDVNYKEMCQLSPGLSKIGNDSRGTSWGNTGKTSPSGMSHEDDRKLTEKVSHSGLVPLFARNHVECSFRIPWVVENNGQRQGCLVMSSTGTQPHHVPRENTLHQKAVPDSKAGTVPMEGLPHVYRPVSGCS